MDGHGPGHGLLVWSLVSGQWSVARSLADSNNKRCDSTLSRLLSVRVEPNLTDDSLDEHSPAPNYLFSKATPLVITSSLGMLARQIKLG